MGKRLHKSILHRKLPRWAFWLTFFIIIYMMSLVIAYEAGKGTFRVNILDIGLNLTKTGKKPIAVPLFVSPENTYHSPRFRFTFDPPEVLRPLREREQLDHLISGKSSDIERFEKLMRWVRNQWPPGRPDPYPPINAMLILDKIRKKETGGFCAQYCFLLVQSLQSLGYKARYVTIRKHEVAEVWSPEFSKWVMLDPMYELYVLKNHIPLSALEIHYMINRRENGLQISAKRSPGDLKDYLSRYEKFAVWAKNDHVSSPINFSDIERYKIYFLKYPKERKHLPPETLFTFFPEDLYFNPLKIR